MKPRVTVDPISGERLVVARARCGLPIRLVPRPGFRHHAAVLSVKYGSVDSRFVPRGKKRAVRVPDGIAHFLEHKMFEKERGDLMGEFAQFGANANAMTGHGSTSYTLSSTGDFIGALDLLLEVACVPYFTEALVEKEQGIIEQEIRGYDDHAGWRGYRAVLEGLYHRHPVRTDIAGTAETIRRITAQDLYACHDAFYVPENMVLTVAGDVAIEDVAARVDALLGTRVDRRAAAERRLPDEPASVRRRRSEVRMPVSMDRLYLGFKGPTGEQTGRKSTQLELSAGMLLDALLGDASSLHEELYAEGLITDGFSWSATSDAGATYVLIGGETPNPKELERRLVHVLREGCERLLPEDAVRRVGRRLLGDFLRAFDSLEVCCWYMVESFQRGLDLFSYPDLVARTGRVKLRNDARALLDADRMTRVIVRSDAS